MNYARLAAPGRVELAEVPAPRAGPGEVVVRMAACGICGTDLEKVRGGYAANAVIGHEPAGVVEQVGAGVRGLAEGTRVAVHHHVPCLACPVCARGDTTFCPTYGQTNLDPGGLAESFRLSALHVERGAALPLDERVSWPVAALLEPAGCVQTALRRLGPPRGASVFVLGLGPAGLLYARLAKLAGAAWVGGSEISPVRRAAAERGGIDLTVDPRDEGALLAAAKRVTDGRGVDLAVVATGALSAVEAAVSIARRGGTVNLFGVPPAGSRLGSDLQSLYLKGIRLVPSYATTEADIAAVHDLVRTGQLTLDDLVSETIPLPRVREAFDRAQDPAASLKVVVTGPAYREHGPGR